MGEWGGGDEACTGGKGKREGVPASTDVCDLTWNSQQNRVFSSRALIWADRKLEGERESARVRDSDCSSRASGERWAGGSRRGARRAAAAVRGVDGGTGVRSGADGRRRRKRRRGSVGRSGRGGGTRAEARCAQAVAGTSPTPGGGGARPGRRANEVPRNAGTPPPPARILGNNPPRVGHLQRHSPRRRQAPRRAPSAAPRAHAPPEERSPRAVPDCSPRPPAGAPPRTRGSWGAVGVGSCQWVLVRSRERRVCVTP